MALEFFRNTVGRLVNRGRARVSLTPEAREIVKKKLGISDEELDRALDSLGQRMTRQVQKDVKGVLELADQKAATKLAPRRKELHDGRTHGQQRNKSDVR